MKKRYMQAMMAGTTALLTLTVPATTIWASVPEKEQTVYVNADESGKIEKVIVSNWLKNTEKKSSITDKTELKNIENVKGEESFSQAGDGTLTWQAEGKDIYYQGETEKELPVSVKMTYFLDEKEIQPTELAGKSGKIKIRINYENKTKETCEINGKTETIQTPFLMVSGMILPTDKFTNVEVKNGTVISDGQDNIIIGMGFPGHSDSLKLSDIKELEDTEIPDYVEITADVKDFSLALTATVATTGTLNELGLENIESLDELKDKMDLLSDSSLSLVKGSQALQEGIETLDTSADTFLVGLSTADDGAGKLKAGIDTMNEKKGELQDGVHQLMEGMKALNHGAGELQKGVHSYTEGTKQLVAGVEQTDSGAIVLKSCLDIMNEQKGELTEGSGKLAEGASALEKGTADFQTKLNVYTGKVSDLSRGLTQLYAGMENSLGGLQKLPEIMKILENGIGNMATGANSFKKGAEQIQSSSQAIEGQLKSLKAAVSGATQCIQQAIDAITNNKIDTSGISQNATQQAQTAAQKKLQAANAQQSQNVQAALKAAGLTEEQKNAVMQNLAGISIDVQDVHIKISPDQINTAVLQQQLQAAKDGLAKISDGLNKINIDDTSITSLTKGAEQAVIGASQMQEELKRISTSLNGMEDIQTMIQQLMESMKQLKDGSLALCGYNQQLNEGAKTLAAGAKNLNSGTGKLSVGVQALGDGVSKLAEGANQLTAGTGQLKTGGRALVANNDKLNAGANQLATGSSALAAGGAKLQSGVSTVSDGVSQLAAGAAQLKDGTGKLTSGGKQLKGGIVQLKDGSTELAEGMKKFDKEGIQELTKVMDGGIQDVLDRLRAIVDADKSYKAFDGGEKATDGSVKFLIETAGIEAKN
ncbi:hypothetical protein [Clostridium polynesiense]|uniref:hypothetical protein n=1 Tax=Clostridium polynesiense TaxID=1325933 RepID=UPI00058ECB2D|nr:hypothetical protein [Clostridium polynesiense]